ncbi:putative uncharacterized protein CIMIP3 [Clytia hemisphaerica]|uniref:putative uncharacterized protein CIMIP3 n=1 Tax=Clytia hemisphaerica TaxID=252671 RepID=UPI0034D62263|eukprot:TCONS_00004015-protein
MPNTGEVQHRGFKNKIYLKKLGEYELDALQKETKRRWAHDELSFSRHNPQKQFTQHRQKRKVAPAYPQLQRKRKNPALQHDAGSPSIRRNKLAPFSTLGKPTCGFNFSRDTDNRKQNFGIMPTNLVKWRSDKLEKEIIH